MSNRYCGSAWEQHFFGRLTSRQIAELPKKNTVLVQMIGAVEQSGPHLPVYTDNLIGETYLETAFSLLSDDASIWLLPPLYVGNSREHMGFAGTITLKPITLMHVIEDIAESVADSGFQKLVLFNTHGGNIDLLQMTTREIRIKTGLQVHLINPGALGLGSVGTTDAEQKIGLHGGDVPTSFILAAKPEWVHMDKAIAEYPNLPNETSRLAMKHKAFAWTMKDVTTSGVTGNAKAATTKKGYEMIQVGGEKLASLLSEVASFDIATIKQHK